MHSLCLFSPFLLIFCIFSKELQWKHICEAVLATRNTIAFQIYKLVVIFIKNVLLNHSG